MTALKRTEHGFEFGAAYVEALCQVKGVVFIGIKTPKGRVQVRVTKTGRVRVFVGGLEMIGSAASLGGEDPHA